MSIAPFKTARAPKPASTAVRRRPPLDFSMTGLVYCAMMLFLGLAAMNTQANLLFGVFGLMIGILAVSWILSRTVLRKLNVRRSLPPHAVVGVLTTFQYELTNAKRYWPSLSVNLAELDGVEGFVKQPQCYLLHAAPKMTASVPAEVMPRRRGLHALGRYQLSTSFPFGFVKRAVVWRKDDSLLVFPAVARVERSLLLLCRAAEETGESERPRPGGADEFFGVREYRAGDNPRWIYWRRSARGGPLVTKEMTRVAPPRLLLLVDTHLPERTPEAHAAVERVIAMAASLASAALDDGLCVGLCASAGNQSLVVPADRGKQQREELLTALARLPLNTEYSAPALLEDSRRVLKSGTTPVLLTPRDWQLNGNERARGGMLVLSAAREESRRWFEFPVGVDFANCMPADQQPAPPPAARPAQKVA